MLSLVIPVYNEEKIIRDTIKSVKIYMCENFTDIDIGYEVLFVNDGSNDNTLEILKELADEYIKPVTYEKNKGKGGAVRTGMLEAAGDLIFYTDCDLAYGLDIIKEGCEFFEKNKGTDMIIGSRRKHRDGYASYTFLRKIMSSVFFLVLKIYGGIKQSDSQSGIKGFKKDAAKKIFNLCEINGWSFDFEVLMIADKLNYKILEMPAKIINHRESKINPIKDSIKMLKDISKIKKRVRQLNL